MSESTGASGAVRDFDNLPSGGAREEVSRRGSLRRSPRAGSDASAASRSGLAGTGDPVFDQARRRFQRCVEWESVARQRFIEDIKFSMGDSDNNYQWPDGIRRERNTRPCLTMNLIRQHNNQVLNPRKRSRSEATVTAAGMGASPDSAKILRAVMRDIQYNSRAQAAYAIGGEFQVYGGIGYWRLITKWLPDSFDQEIEVAPIEDPLSVYLDPDIKQRDGSDANFGFIFDNVPNEEFFEAYPEFEHLMTNAPLGVGTGDGDWIGQTHTRVCEYFRRVQTPDRLYSFVGPDGLRRNVKKSLLNRAMVRALDSSELTHSRDIWREEIEWKLIVGERVIDETVWPGANIPIIRCVGEQTVIDGIMDRKGHTRWMKDAQRMFNYNASSQVEFVALQSKTPWVSSAAAIEEQETLWNSANTQNHSVLIFNHVDDEGNAIPPEAMPRRQEPPNASPAYETGMKSAFDQMMMTSGQWQNQMGMQGNERTGAAIDARTDQGDTATYHLQANYQDALVATGMQIIDLIPKIYTTRRVKLIQGDDGSDMELEIDPAAKAAYAQLEDRQGRVIARIFNPLVGKYNVKATIGQEGTKRQETVKALTLILTQNPGLTGIVGDLLLSSMDFEAAQEAAQRLKRMVPPQALGNGPSQSEQQLGMQLKQTQVALAQALQKLGKEQLKLTGKEQMRNIDVYKAETDRMKALADQLPTDPEALESMIHDLMSEAAQTHLAPILEANQQDIGDGGGQGQSSTAAAPAQAPPMPGAQRGGDGEWYLSDPTRRGRYLRIAPLAQEHSQGNILQ